MAATDTRNEVAPSGRMLPERRRRRRGNFQPVTMIHPSHVLRGLLMAATIATSVTAASPPNVLIVLADDLGYSDIGCYGSEIPTPNIDRLASEGLRFSSFYNTAKCHSSRVSLLSGRYPYQAGNVRLRHSVTLPEVLGGAGYFAAMVGKWHLKQEPTDFGFVRYFGHLSGFCNYYRGDNTFRLNGKPWPVPKEGFYTTVNEVDYALKFLADAREARKPWFLYVAFNAPHAPLQPLEEDYRRHLGEYDAGWDKIRAARVARQIRANLFGHEIVPSPRPDHIPAWNSLTPRQREVESQRMAAYAALIDRVDRELGRLFANLEASGEWDNTLIVFLSDNGACPYNRRGIDPLPPYDPASNWSDSTGWAWMRNTPFRFYKQNQYEGGAATPAIVHWPAGLKTAPGAVVHDPAHLVDVLPTLAEATGAAIPARWPGRDLNPLGGVSLAPVLAGHALGRRPPIYLLYDDDRGLRDGDWKIVSFRRGPWELYNLAEDRTEMHDVAAQFPDIRDRMARQWFELARDMDHASHKRLEPVLIEAKPKEHPEWSDYSRPDMLRQREKRERSVATKLE